MTDLEQVASANGDRKRGDGALNPSVLVTDPEVVAELARHGDDYGRS